MKPTGSTFTLNVGAGDPEEAIARAEQYLRNHGIAAAFRDWRGGERLKVGVAGLRRYSVRFEKTA